jgi:ligand-binding sensor domain-containing protein
MWVLCGQHTKKHGPLFPSRNGTVRRPTFKIASVRKSYGQNLHTPIGSPRWEPPSRMTSRSADVLLADCTDISQTMNPELPVRIFLILFCSVLACPSANAVDPDRRISQYAHTAWRVRDGVFAGAPTAITQTADGYVWIGTLGGLLRFDGVRFVRWTRPAGEHLPTTAVISLLGAADGSLWIGTAAGLAQWKNGNLLNFPETAGRVNSIYEDREGTIWMARSRTRAGAVCKVTLSVAKCYAPKDGVPPYAGTLTGDNFGYLWIGTSTALVRWKPGSSYFVRVARTQVQRSACWYNRSCCHS